MSARNKSDHGGAYSLDKFNTTCIGIGIPPAAAGGIPTLRAHLRPEYVATIGRQPLGVAPRSETSAIESHSYFFVREVLMACDEEKLEALAPIVTAPIKHHIFVCTGKSCSAVESAEVKAAFERELLGRGILFGKVKKGKNPKGSVVLTECGSVGFCAIGAAVMVYPDGIWYGQVRAEDVAEIVEQHIVGGNIVERLALMTIPSNGTLAEEPVRTEIA